MGKYDEAMAPCLDQKIIYADGLFFRYCHADQSYIPEEIVDLRDLMRSLDEELSLLTPNECNRTQSSPRSVPSQRKRSDGDGSFDSRSGSFVKTFSSYGSSPTKRRTLSGSSETTTPNSVLIKVPPVKTDTDDEEDPWLYLTKDQCHLPMEKYKEQLKWLCEQGDDYVAMETVQTLPEVFAYLTAITKTTCPLLLDIRINNDKSLTLTYQICKVFKQDFMMIKLGDEYCMFMAPF